MKLAAVAATLLLISGAPVLAQTTPVKPAAPSAPAATPAVSADPAPAGKYSLDTPIETIAADPAGKAVLDADFPGMTAHPAYEQFKAMSLNAVQPLAQGQITDEQMAKAKADLAALK